MIVNVPDEVARRLEAAAAARGVTVEELAVEVLAVNTPAVGETPRRRRLGFVGIGVSENGITGRAGELLADGFGRD